MCGIAGIIRRGQNIQESEIQSVGDFLKHRGPDAVGTFIHDNVGFVHTRLSIIDLQTGGQPMTSQDGNTTLVFNGEIYNYLEIKETLLRTGISFNTKSDTEVVLHAYRKWGVDCVKLFRGMFAFAVYDAQEKKIFLARDHIGIKPMFFLKTEKLFAFASELQAIVNLPGFKKALNVESLDAYLAFLYIPAPMTAFANVFKLEPGNWMEFDINTFQIRKESYWKINFNPVLSITKQEFDYEISNRIKQSVSKHLVSDVDFGAFLSGGIDSTAVVQCMSEIIEKPVKTFSIGFNNQDFDETKFAKHASNILGTNHFQQYVNAEAMSIIPDLIRNYGEPFGDSSAIPTFYVSKMARSHVKMVLSGDGGDELLGGYENYNRFYNTISLSGMGRFKKTIYPVFSALMPGRYPNPYQAKTWSRIVSYLDFDNRKKIWSVSNQRFLKDQSSFFGRFFQDKGADFLQAAQLADLYTYLPGDILFKVDIASMMHGLEVRTPFVDKELWEYVTSAPSNYYASCTGSIIEGKLPLKRLLSTKFDDGFINRKKMGFAIPLKSFIGMDNFQGKKLLKYRFSNNKFFSELFNSSEIMSLIDQENAGATWAFLVLDEWLNQHFD